LDPTFFPYTTLFRSGNPDLKPEDARTVEIGAAGKFDWANWSLNLYETRIDDLIAYDAGIFTSANIDKARIRGLEALFSTRIKGWHLNSHLTFLDPIDRSTGISRGNILPRRSKQAFRIDTFRQYGNHYVLGDMFVTDGQCYDDLKMNRTLDAVVKLVLRADSIFNCHSCIRDHVDILFDNNFDIASFFNQPRRNFYISLRY